MRHLVFWLLALISTAQLQAQCCSGGVPMSGNIGLPATEKGTFQVTVNYDWNNLETLMAGSEKLNDKSRRRETHAILIEGGYAISERWSLDVFFSLVRQERTINQRGLSEDFIHTQGVGDAVGLLKYKVIQGLNLGLGVKAPLGASNRTRENGLPLNADLQPGSGAWDMIVYANYLREFSFRPTLTISGTAIHRFTGSNSNYLGSSTYAFGDETQLILGIGDRFNVGKIFIDPSLRLRYRKAGRDQFNSTDFPASGGDFVFVNPGVSMVLSPSWSYQFNIGLPLYARVQDTQLSPTVRVNTGFHFTLPKKASFDIIEPTR